MKAARANDLSLLFHGHGVLKRLAGLEHWHLGGRRDQLLASLGIADLLLSALTHLKAPEAYELHFITGNQHFGQRPDHRVGACCGLLLFNAFLLRKFADKVLLVHLMPLPLVNSFLFYIIISKIQINCKSFREKKHLFFFFLPPTKQSQAQEKPATQAAQRVFFLEAGGIALFSLFVPYSCNP